MKLEKISEAISMLRPGESISPRYLTRISQVNKEIIIVLLMGLKNRNLINVQFIIHCTNEGDMLHAFQFESNDELIQFVKKQNHNCPDCYEKLDNNDIRVSFVAKENKSYGEEYV